MATSNPLFPQSVKVGMAQVTTANTNLDGVTGTYVTVFTAGLNGARVERSIVKAAGNTASSGMVRFFLTDGTNTRLLAEVQPTTTTPSGGTPAFTADVPALAGMLIPAGWSIKASTHNAETHNIFIEYGDY